MISPVPPAFELLLKPVGARCNLDCAYCFYGPGPGVPGRSGGEIMSGPVLETVIRTYLELPLAQHIFTWQGGEPLLAGLDFFREVIRLQEKHARPGAVIANSLQTNATLVNRETARFLADRNFLVGCSLDGPAAVHDHFRTGPRGNGSHAATLDGLDLLCENGVAVNILAVVSRAGVGKAEEIYRYLVDRGHHHLQFIPCVEFDEQGRPQPWTITGQEWGEYLCAVFAIWRREHTYRVSVRNFDEVMIRAVTGRSASCVTGTACNQVLVVEHDGNVYPCDFFVGPETRLGNVMTHGWAKLAALPGFAAFSARKLQLATACRECALLAYCHGGCPRNRVAAVAGGAATDHLCEGWKMFFARALDDLVSLARDHAERQGD